MDRTLEVLEGNVDRLLARHSALISERNGLQAVVDDLQRRTGQLEAGLAAARSEVARLEQLLGRESGRSRKAAGEIQSLIDRLEGRGEVPQAAIAPRAAEMPQPALVPRPSAVPRQTVHAPQVVPAAVSPAAVQPQTAVLPLPAAAPPAAEDPFETAVSALRGIALDREHATTASGMNKRLF